MIKETSSLPQEPVRLFRPKAWQLAVLVLLLGVLAGAAVTQWRASLVLKREKERAAEVMGIAMRVRAAQNNVNTDVRSINYDILVLGLSSADIGQRPDTLAPFGIKTADMRQEPGVAVAVRRKPRVTEMD